MTVDATESAKDKGSKSGYHLRWSRLQKTVEIKDISGGLLRGSIIAGPPKSAAETTPQEEGPSSENAAGNIRKDGSRWGSLQNLSFRGNSAATSNRRVILDQVSGDAAPGEVVAAMGPSGSGYVYTAP